MGQTKLEFSKGVATTTELTITYAPSSDVPVEASLSLGKHTFVSPILRVALRACEAGEELALGGAACSACPAGSYGFDPALPCASCPDYATCAGGLSVVLDKGYWRSAYDSVNIRKCPWEAYCNAASTQLFGNGTGRHPGVQCDKAHAGPLCALCDRGYKLSTSDGDCVKCSGGGSQARTTSRLYGLACGVVLVALLVAFTRRFAKPCYEAGAEVATTLSFYFDEIRAVFKILLVFYQIIGNVPRCFPRLDLPNVFEDFSLRLSFLDFDLASRAARESFSKPRRVERCPSPYPSSGKE